MPAELFIEYFPENGDLHTPLVLIHGHHIPTARELYHAIRALRDQRETEIDVHLLPGFAGIDGLQLHFVLATENLGIHSSPSRHFICALTPDGWEAVGDVLAPFCDRYATTGSFNTLDASGPIRLLFSTGRGW